MSETLEAPAPAETTPAPALTEAPTDIGKTTPVLLGEDPPKPVQQAEQKPAPGAEKDTPKAPEVPEKYEFKAPEGVTFDDATLATFSETAKGLKLTQEQAQALVDFQVSRETTAQAANRETYRAMVEGWADSARKDGEIGGAKFDESLASAKLALDKVGTPELKRMLTEYGVGNHPEIIRVFSKVGAMFKEDSVNPGGGSPGGQARDPFQVLFPKTLGPNS